MRENRTSGLTSGVGKRDDAWRQHPRPTSTLPPVDFLFTFIHHGSMEIEFTTQIFREGRTYVAHTPNLDVSSCGGTKERALKNLKEAVHLFLEEAEKMGTLDQILQEAGYSKRRSKLEGPKFVGTQRVSLPLPFAHA